MRGPEIVREGWVSLTNGSWMSGSCTPKRYQNMTDPPCIASKLVNLHEYIKFIEFLLILTGIFAIFVMFSRRASIDRRPSIDARGVRQLTHVRQLIDVCQLTSGPRPVYNDE